MLAIIQKKLLKAKCPSCEKTGVLQASLTCDRDEKKCSTTCQCGHCGLRFHVVLPEGANELTLSKEELIIECDISSRACSVKAS